MAGWLIWQQPAVFLPQVILEGCQLRSLLYLFAELLFGAGCWMSCSVITVRVQHWVDAIAAALLHFIKPLAAILKTWPQFQRCLLGLTFSLDETIA